MSNQIFIRKCKPKDIPEVIELCKLHAEYEKSEYDPAGKAEKLSDALFKKDPDLFCWVVEGENQLVGYFTLIPQFSTWDASWYLYMDCLYIRDNYRSQGIGKKVIDQIKKFASEKNYTCIQWQTPEFNKRAIAFYKREGGIGKKKERFFLYP